MNNYSYPASHPKSKNHCSVREEARKKASGRLSEHVGVIDHLNWNDLRSIRNHGGSELLGNTSDNKSKTT